MLTDIELRPNKQNWASMVKNLLSRLGFLEVWNAQGVGNINNFLYIFKTRVRDIYIYKTGIPDLKTQQEQGFTYIYQILSFKDI